MSSKTTLLPLYKDRSDLRLSARYVYQQATNSSSLSSLISIKCCLQAIFGVDEEKSLSGSFHQIFTKRSSLEKLILEEAHKLYDGNDDHTNSDNNYVTEENINHFLPLEEALFVKIAERIYLHQQQLKEENSAVEKNMNTHHDEQTLNAAFWNQLLQFTSSSSTNSHNHERCSCCTISKETFLKAASHQTSSSSVNLSSETANTIWKNLLDCEMILMRNEKGSSFSSACSQCVSQKNNNNNKSVSFAFSQIDANRNTCNNDNGEFIRKETIDRCLQLGTRFGK